MSTLHSRMPVILEKADWPLWLGEADAGAEMLLRPAPEGSLRIWPVDKRVGNVRNYGPVLLSLRYRRNRIGLPQTSRTRSERRLSQPPLFFLFEVHAVAGGHTRGF
jgi:hypothetical protein